MLTSIRFSELRGSDANDRWRALVARVKAFGSGTDERLQIILDVSEPTSINVGVPLIIPRGKQSVVITGLGRDVSILRFYRWPKDVPIITWDATARLSGGGERLDVAKLSPPSLVLQDLALHRERSDHPYDADEGYGPVVQYPLTVQVDDRQRVVEDDHHRPVVLELRNALFQRLLLRQAHSKDGTPRSSAITLDLDGTQNARIDDVILEGGNTGGTGLRVSGSGALVQHVRTRQGDDSPSTFIEFNSGSGTLSCCRTEGGGIYDASFDDLVGSAREQRAGELAVLADYVVRPRVPHLATWLGAELQATVDRALADRSGLYLVPVTPPGERPASPNYFHGVHVTHITGEGHLSRSILHVEHCVGALFDNMNLPQVDRALRDFSTVRFFGSSANSVVHNVFKKPTGNGQRLISFDANSQRNVVDRTFVPARLLPAVIVDPSGMNPINIQAADELEGPGSKGALLLRP